MDKGPSTVKHGVERTRERLADAVGALRHKADAGLPASKTTQRALGVVSENPIVLALGAFAAGFLGGFLLPATRWERERLGPIRDKVVDQAQAAASDLAQAGMAVVAETVQSAVDTALSSAQSHSREVVEAVKSRARPG